mgnify:CR=1 FL=1
MDQTDRNALDYESCRRVWRRVSPELDPYPEEREEAGCPAAPAPDLKGLQEMIEGELGDRRAYLEAARRAPNPAARRMMQRMADREGAHARRLLAVYYLACGQCYRPALASGPGETLPWRQLLRQRYHQEVCAARQSSLWVSHGANQDRWYQYKEVSGKSRRSGTGQIDV